MVDASQFVRRYFLEQARMKTNLESRQPFPLELLVCRVGRPIPEESPVLYFKLLSFAAACSAMILPVFAQAPAPASAPSAHLMQIGATRFLEDLDAAMSLTNSSEQTQTKVIHDYIEEFLKGVSRDAPFRMDYLLSEEALKYRTLIPVKSTTTFMKKNLGPNGIQVNRRLARSLYKMKGAFVGYMRIENDYAQFAEDRGNVPPKMADPRKAINALAEKDYDAAFELRNQHGGIKERRQMFRGPKGLRQELLATVKKTKSETQNEFELRKLFFEHQLDEMERLIVETELGLVGFMIDAKEKNTSSDLSLTAIPETSLEKMIEELGQAPSEFANVAAPEQPILSLRLNHPFKNDTMRQENALEFFALLKDIAHRQSNDRADQTPEQSAASKKAADLIHDLMADTVKAGLADLFLDLHKPSEASEVYTVIGGFRATDGLAAIEILKTLQQTREGREVKMNLEKVGETDIHSIAVSEVDQPAWKNLVGDNVMFVGTAKEKIWIAGGPDAQAGLKAAIEAADKPNTGKATDPVMTLTGRFSAWAEIQERRLGDKSDEQVRKIRKMMIAAGEPGDDNVEMKLERKGAGLVGSGSSGSGLLRFIGKVLADFSLDQLDGSGKRPRAVAKAPAK